MKILLIKQTSLGDLIHSTLALEAIKQKWPDAEIHFMVDRSCAFAVENNPLIDHFYYFDKIAFKKQYKQNKLHIFNIMADVLNNHIDIDVLFGHNVENFCRYTWLVCNTD